MRPLLLGLAAIGLNLLGCGTTPPTPAEAAAAPSSGKVSYSNAWRIEVSEGATQDVRVVIDDGTSEDHVARVIKNTFEDQLDTSRYDIEMDDEEDVLVKKDLTEQDSHSSS
jgi:hypothetical protein